MAVKIPYSSAGLGGGSKFVNGSPIIDYIRMVKDEKEKDLMRKSSKLNDIAMEKIIPWVAKGLTEKELNAKMREIYKEIDVKMYRSIQLQHTDMALQIHIM